LQQDSSVKSTPSELAGPPSAQSIPLLTSLKADPKLFVPNLPSISPTTEQDQPSQPSPVELVALARSFELKETTFFFDARGEEMHVKGFVWN